MSPPPGTFVVGKHLYTYCKRCGKLVCLTKWLLGALHVCATTVEPPR